MPHVLDKLGRHAVVILRFWTASYSTVDLCPRFEQSAVIGRGCRERVQPEELVGAAQGSARGSASWFIQITHMEQDVKDGPCHSLWRVVIGRVADQRLDRQCRHEHDALEQGVFDNVSLHEL